MALQNDSKSGDMNADQLLKENQELKQKNNELLVQLKQLKDQVAMLQSDTSTKDDVISALELELNSVLKFTSSPDTKQLKESNGVNPKENKQFSSHQIVPSKSNQKESKPLLPTTSANNQKEDKPLTASKDSKKKTTNAKRGVVGIVGAEQVGSQLAALLALKGYTIVLIEARKIVVEKSKKIWGQILESFMQQNRTSKEDKERASKSISYIVSVSGMKTHAESMRIIIDTARDEHKREVLQQIMKFVNPQCMVISDSPSQCITKRASYIAPDRRSHLIGINLLHFGVDLVNNKVIEVVPSWNTSPEIVNRCKSLIANDLSRRCVVVRDAAAMISNRLLAVYLNEAFSILECTLCSAEEMDAVMDLVMNSKFGPFRMADKIGLNVVRGILEDLYLEYGAQKYVPNAMLKQYVRSGRWGRRTGTGVYNYMQRSTK